MNASEPFWLCDDFLPPGLHDALLAHALASEGRFSPALVRIAGASEVYEPGSRLSWKCDSGLGDHEREFAAALEAVVPDALAALGIKPFPQSEPELELVAHRDGSYFKLHMDTLTGGQRDNEVSDRIVSMIYYFHAEPRGFGGGDIVLAEFGPFPATRFEASDNRLLAFPSFVPHHVEPISCPGGNQFAAARFAVNCWLRRPRSLPAES